LTQTDIHIQPQIRRPAKGQVRFIIGGAAIVAAIVYLVVSNLQSTAQYFYTVQEIQSKEPSVVGQNLRASGVVLGDTIVITDHPTLKVTFVMANISNDNKDIEAAGGLAAALHQAALNTNSPRMKVVYAGPKPDLLQNEAQAIVTGKVGADGVFYADEVLLKCPTRYEAQVPAQVPTTGK
jgi:cytochrome c-type biogenesis protein CcmE